MRVVLYTFHKWLYTTVYRSTLYSHPCILFIYLLWVVINRYKYVYITSVHYYMHKTCDTTSHHEVIRSCEQLHDHIDLVYSTLLTTWNNAILQKSRFHLAPPITRDMNLRYAATSIMIRSANNLIL